MVRGIAGVRARRVQTRSGHGNGERSIPPLFDTHRGSTGSCVLRPGFATCCIEFSEILKMQSTLRYRQYVLHIISLKALLVVTVKGACHHLVACSRWIYLNELEPRAGSKDVQPTGRHSFNGDNADDPFPVCICTSTSTSTSLDMLTVQRPHIIKAHDVYGIIMYREYSVSLATRCGKTDEITTVWERSTLIVQGMCRKLKQASYKCDCDCE